MRISYFILFLSTLLLVSCFTRKENIPTVVVDEKIEVPIDGCIEGNKLIMGDAIDTKAYCTCLVPKFYEVIKDDPKKVEYLEKGLFDKAAIGNAIEFKKIYAECLTPDVIKDSFAKINMPPSMFTQLKQGFMTSFQGTEVEKTNDLNKYCDCIVYGIRDNFTALDIIKGTFAESKEYANMISNCKSKTKLK